jgi:hypothetical protein
MFVPNRFSAAIGPATIGKFLEFQTRVSYKLRLTVSLTWKSLKTKTHGAKSV